MGPISLSNKRGKQRIWGHVACRFDDEMLTGLVTTTCILASCVHRKRKRGRDKRIKSVTGPSFYSEISCTSGKEEKGP